MEEEKMKHKIFRQVGNYAPPGLDVKREIKYFRNAFVCSFLWSLIFLHRYFEERAYLFEKRMGKMHLRKNASMPSFEVLTEDVFIGFILTIIFLFILVAYHYFYHYQGSKIIYLMKRLPNKKEFHLRCWILPMLASGITVITMIILKVMFYLIYIFATPSQCLPS